MRREQGIEPLVAVGLAAATGFDDAVGVEHERGACRKLLAQLFVALTGVDSEGEPARLESRDLAARPDEPRPRVVAGSTVR